MKKFILILCLTMACQIFPVLCAAEEENDDDKAWPGILSNPFVAAVLGGRVEIALDMLKDGKPYEGNINVRFDKDWRLLHYAAHFGSPNLCLQLIRMGARVDVREAFGNTPLHLAAGRGDVQCILTLSLKGANINAINKSGKTPLHLAVENDCHDAEKALLRMGAKSDIQDEDGKTQKDYADTAEAKKSFESVENGAVPSDGTPELLWESIKDNDKLFASDREKIQAILDNPKYGSKLKKQMIREILKKRNIGDSNEPDAPPDEKTLGEDGEAEQLWEHAKTSFNLYASDREEIQKILKNQNLSGKRKRELVANILKKRGIE